MSTHKKQSDFDFDKTWRRMRDVFLFFGGLVGVFYETIVAKSVEPTLLLLFGAMMGLPAFLRKDES